MVDIDWRKKVMNLANEWADAHHDPVNRDAAFDHTGPELVAGMIDALAVLIAAEIVSQNEFEQALGKAVAAAVALKPVSAAWARGKVSGHG